MNYNKTTYLLALCITIVNSDYPIFDIASYKATPLINLVDNVGTMQNTISFGYRIFDEIECKRILGRALVMEKEYQPIQITVVNNTDRYLLFSSTNFSFPCESYFKVAENVRFSFFRETRVWIMGFLLTDLIVSNNLPSILEVLAKLGIVSWSRINTFFVNCSTISRKLSYFFLIPTIMQAIECPKANKKLFADYAKKALPNKIIAPYSSVNGIIFVENQFFDPTFSFKLIDQANGEQYILSTTNQQIQV